MRAIVMTFPLTSVNAMDGVRHILWASVVALGIGAAASHADSPAQPRAYEIATTDGTHLFRMFPPGGRSPAGQRSGLYRTGSDDPLWTVNWYAPAVELSRDGRYLVRRGPWASSFDDLAIAFYDRGRLLNAYAIHELVPDRDSVQRSVSHFTWLRKLEVDADALRTVLATHDTVYEFDLRTGQMRQARRATAPYTPARILDVDERWIDVDRLFSCWSVAATIMPLPHNGEPFLTGMIYSSGAASDRSRSGDMAAIPYRHIRHINARVDQGSIIWEVTLRNGEQHPLTVSGGETSVCVQSGNDEARQLPIETIVRIEVGNTVRGSQQALVDANQDRDKVVTPLARVKIVDGPALFREAALDTLPEGSKLRRLIASLRDPWTRSYTGAEANSPELTTLLHNAAQRFGTEGRDDFLRR